MGGIDFVITITDRSRGEMFLARYRSHGVSMVLGALGHGTATEEVLDYLGLEATEKAVLFCMVAQAQVKRFVKDIVKELWLDVPGNGILLTVPVSSIGGAATKAYFIQDQPMQTGEIAMEKTATHELIIVITNQGFTDQVMDAARGAGATGGTVLHAKGTGMELARKFFGVSIAAEKEMIFIVANQQDKNAIMKAVMADVGMQSKAQSMVFSLPVNQIAGLRLLEEEA